MVAYILPTDIHRPISPWPWGGVKIQLFFSEHGHVDKSNLREWSIVLHASSYSLLAHTLNLWVGFKGKTKSECGHGAYQIKGKEG